MTTIGLAVLNLESALRATWATFLVRLRIMSRYPGALVLELFIPVVFAALPIFMGLGIAGDEASAAASFSALAQTEDYKLYLLLGANLFLVVSILLYVVALWVRREQQTGTLEAVYMAPTSRLHILGGVTLYALVRATVAFFAALLVGGFLLGVNPLRGDLWIASAFLLVGLLPLAGLSFLFGALVLRVKDAGPLINLLQWPMVFFMGVDFPLAVLPLELRLLALGFPPTWMANGVRAAMLDVAYLLGAWPVDLTVLAAMGFGAAVLGYGLFRFSEDRLRSREGVGTY